MFEGLGAQLCPKPFDQQATQILGTATLRNRCGEPTVLAGERLSLARNSGAANAGAFPFALFISGLPPENRLR
jgi:hypothetical protein